MAQRYFGADQYPVGTQLQDLDGWDRVAGTATVEVVERTEGDGTTVNKVWRTSGEVQTTFVYSGVPDTTQLQTARVVILDNDDYGLFWGGLGSDGEDQYSGQNRQGSSPRIIRISGSSFDTAVASGSFGDRAGEDRYALILFDATTDGSTATLELSTWQNQSNQYDPFPEDWSQETLRLDSLTTTDTQTSHQSPGPVSLFINSVSGPGDEDTAYFSFGTDGDPAPLEPVDQGGEALTVRDAVHGHTADQPSLTEMAALAVQDVSHSHMADGLTLQQAHVLTVDAVIHGHRSESPTLTEAALLSPQSARHLHRSEQVALAQAHALAVADATHGHLTDTAELTQSNTVSAHAARHTHTTETVDLGVGDVMSVREVLHAHSADEVALTQAQAIAVQTVRHQHGAQTVTLSESIILSAGSVTQSHTSERATLTQGHLLAVQSLTHSHTAEELALLTDATLIVSDVLHAHLAERMVFDGTVFRAGRLLVVQGHDRLLVVAPTQPFMRVTQ